MDDRKKRLHALSQGPGRKFLSYHPFLTYSNPDSARFVDPNGKPREVLNPDSYALFQIGEDAFKRLGGLQYSREDFEIGYAGYWAILDEARTSIHESFKEGQIRLVKESGEGVDMVNADDIDDAQVIAFFWNRCSQLKGRMDDEISQVIRLVFLFHTFREIDNSLIGMKLDGREAVVAAIGAANSLANAIAIECGNEHLREARQQLAYQAVQAKLARDPKQREKAFVRECWKAWQEKPDSYNGKAAFARDMLTKCEHLESQKKIEDWCRDWEAQSKNGTQPEE